MKSTLIPCIGLMAISFVTNAYADCAFPKAPDAIPDGKTAAEADMISAMAVFKKYNADVDAYLACLDTETDSKIKESGAANVVLQLKAMQQKKRSSATDEREAKVNNFNEQVRAFKARKS